MTRSRVQPGHATVLIAALVLCLVTAGCAGAKDHPTTGSTPTPDPMATPSVNGRFPVGPQRRLLALKCWGRGSTTVVYEAGSGASGIQYWAGSAVMRGLGATHRQCVYDRAGTGLSDPAPNRRRLVDDVVADLHELLATAGIASPFVIVGQSGGGDDAYHYAGRYPDQVAGLVLLDVPAPQATMSPADVAELAWDHPSNVEHVDYVAVERQLALHRLPIKPIPVTVITAKYGQSAGHLDEQRVWLQRSSHPV